jgi:hypothetical protein
MTAFDLAQNPDVAEIHRASHGARRSTPKRRKTDELVKQYSGLASYQIAERWEIIDLLHRIGPDVGLTHELINHLDYIMKRIPPAEWEIGGTPIFFKSVLFQARELHVTDRAIRYREEKLADMGFLAFHDSSNNRRYADRCPRTKRIYQAFGVSLIPLMMRMDELRELDFVHKQKEEYWKQTRKHINILRRKIMSLINEACEQEDLHDDVTDWAEEFAAIRLVRANDSNRVLEARLEQYSGLYDRIKSTLAAHEDLGINCEWTQSTSSKEEVQFRYTESYREGNSHTAYSNPVGDYLEQSSPEGSQVIGSDVSKAHADQVNASQEEACAKFPKHKGKKRLFDQKEQASEVEQALTGAEYLTPAYIYEASCADFRAVIDEITAVDKVKGASKVKDLTTDDIRMAALRLRPHLSVSEYTWVRAQNVMGSYGAAIALMLCCRPHVKCAGSYLNGMITAQHEGKLNLHKSVFGKLYEGKSRGLNS